MKLIFYFATNCPATNCPRRIVRDQLFCDELSGNQASEINSKKFQLKKIPDPSISLNPLLRLTFTPTSPVRNLGVIFVQNLSFSDHITRDRDLRRIRPMLDLKTASTIATSIVLNSDWCISVLDLMFRCSVEYELWL